jgi:hypothetical protein
MGLFTFYSSIQMNSPFSCYFLDLGITFKDVLRFEERNKKVASGEVVRVPRLYIPTRFKVKSAMIMATGNTNIDVTYLLNSCTTTHFQGFKINITAYI